MPPTLEKAGAFSHSRSKYFSNMRGGYGQGYANAAAARKRLRFGLEHPDAYLRQQEALLDEMREVEGRLTPKYNWLAPGGSGYGGYKQWPFDGHRAKVSDNYRAGIRKALTDLRYHPAWREAARNNLALLLKRMLEEAREIEAIEHDVHWED